MQIIINVDELRSIAPLAVRAAEKMNEANTVISSVISTHNWKCPERAVVDESLETIKDNSKLLNDTFIDFSNRITEIANEYTDYINEQKRFDIEYHDDIASLMSKIGALNCKTTVSSGSHVAGMVSDLEMTSMHSSNISSLHGASHGINIVDFTLFS